MALKDYGNGKNNLGYLDKIINNTDNYGVFSFAACATIKKENQSESRCDSDSVGPVCITWDGKSAYSLPLNISLSDVKFLKIILDFAPNFYIIYFLIYSWHNQLFYLQFIWFKFKIIT